MDETRLIEIETKIAFLERTVDELNGVLLEVRAQVDRIEQTLSQTREQLEQQAASGADLPFQKPPHY